MTSIPTKSRATKLLARQVYKPTRIAVSKDDLYRRMDDLLRMAFLVALAAVFFIAGSLFMASEVFPGPQIARAYDGGRSLYYKLTQFQDVYSTDLWFAEPGREQGVTVYVPDTVYQGMTLYTSGHEAAAHLISLEGRVLHTWRRPFSTLQEAGIGSIDRHPPDSHVYFRQAQIFPNGDLLAIYESVGDTPYGYGLVKLDQNSEVLWFYEGRAHHQFDVTSEGTIYVLTHEFVDDKVPEFSGLKQPRLEDFLVILSAEGKELKKVRLLTAVADSPYRHLLHTVAHSSLADPLHTNAVKYIDHDTAARFAFGEEGQILLSFRETHSLAVLDPATEKIVWATRGPWIGQHDPDILPNGNILLFDNYGNFDNPEGFSRVLEIDPNTMEIVWRYTGTPRHPLDSLIRADQQRLANGNTLITESSGGRIIEVTPEGETAWEFVNPVRGGKNREFIPIIAWAQRLEPEAIQPALLQPSN